MRTDWSLESKLGLLRHAIVRLEHRRRLEHDSIYNPLSTTPASSNYVQFSGCGPRYLGALTPQAGDLN